VTVPPSETAERRNEAPQPPPRQSLGQRMSAQLREVTGELGGMSVLLWDSIKALTRRPFEFQQLIYQVEQMGVRSIGIAAVTAVFTGMVMAVQFAFGLERFGARDYVGRVIGLSITRELAPALTSLVVGSRIGAGMAAELGSMNVTEQIDAIRALGADPVKKLVVPRVLACLILMPVLALFADVLGFGGAMFVSSVQFGTPPDFFYRSGLDSVEMADFLSGLGKTPFFGILIAIIGCYHGLNTRGGTEGVGKSTTRTVVFTSVAVLLSDFFLTKLFIALTPSAG
jgi:phospholipid/cholesterol/gamma-HCH transport system permease protein